jgi:SAM-dependent methyltransferase
MSNESNLEVAAANLDAWKSWDGEQGDFWVEHAEQFDRGVAGYHEALFQAAAIAPTDRVLDIGCGTGSTSLEAARRATAGAVVGVDLSRAMLECGRANAASLGLTNVRFEQSDVQIHAFEPESFDVAISRAGCMFFGDPRAAYTNIARALRPGGRIALLTWQTLGANEWIATIRTIFAAGRELPSPPPDAPGPFSMADPDRVRSLLVGAGFSDVEIEAREEPMNFGPIDEARVIAFGLGGWMLEGLDEDARANALVKMDESLTAHLTDDGVAYGSATLVTSAHT